MFNINKIGIVWTTAFIAWNLAFILDGSGLIVHGVCMMGQIMLLFLFMWLIAKQRKHELFMEEWRKEIEERKREIEEYKNFRRQVEEYKDGMA